MTAEQTREARERMVQNQLARRGIRDERVLAAIGRVPRERFVPAAQAEAAYADSPLPIGDSQTISQPYIVALMTEALEVGPADRVVEIGTGSGYGAAILAEMAAQVYTVERHERLAREATERLAALGYENVAVRAGDGTLGWPEQAPYDAIAVTAGGPAVPKALREQLAEAGRLVMPVGELDWSQKLVRLRRGPDGAFEEEELSAVCFVPLIGEQGWRV